MGWVARFTSPATGANVQLVTRDATAREDSVISVQTDDVDGAYEDAQLAADAIRIAATARGGRSEIDGVIFHTDHGSTYTASSFTVLCKDRLGIRQSMGRVGSCFDNAAAESFFSTLEHEVLSQHHFATRAEARALLRAWCHDFYNTDRRHSSAAMLAPIDYENTAAQPTDGPEAA